MTSKTEEWRFQKETTTEWPLHILALGQKIEFILTEQNILIYLKDLLIKSGLIYLGMKNLIGQGHSEVKILLRWKKVYGAKIPGVRILLIPNWYPVLASSFFCRTTFISWFVLWYSLLSHAGLDFFFIIHLVRALASFGWMRLYVLEMRPT